MSEDGTSKGHQGRRPLLIENIYEKETSESFIERHFRERLLHRCRSTAEFDVDAIVRDFGEDLVRSSQDIEPDPDGAGLKALWAMLIFRRPGLVFWHFLIKGSNTHESKENARVFALTVTAESAVKAAEEALVLQKKYTASDDTPGFLLLRHIGAPRRIPLQPQYLLSAEFLDLHYGPGFAEWSADFAAGLKQSGLSILRGKPGTGKTSFLRHLICTLSGSHRFYYVPVDSFGLLSAQLSDFLAKERRRHGSTSFVVVLEDAEELLLNRRGSRDGLVSSLLNFTDGFIGDMVKAHLICTINSEMKDLDEAVLRPGRQRFFREFDLLDWPQSQALAASLQVELTEKRAYSLAELYHFKDAQNTERLRKEERPSIGFAVA